MGCLNSTPLADETTNNPLQQQQPGVAPAQQHTVHTSNVGKYKVGQRVEGLNRGKISGVIISILPEAGRTDGPGHITVQEEQEVPTVMKTVKTSNIAKYRVGQRVEGMAAGTITGVILQLVGDVPGASSG